MKRYDGKKSRSNNKLGPQYKRKFAIRKELTVKDVADENVVKEAHAGNTTASLGARGLLIVQCIEKRGL